MHHPITATVSAFSRGRSPQDTLPLLCAAGFEGVDFPLSVYSSDPNAPLMQDDWLSWARRTAQTLNALHLPVVQAHAPWEQRIADLSRYEAPWTIYERVMEVCHLFGCRHLIFHPLRQLDRVDSLSMRQRIHDYNVRWFHDLLPWAERFDIIINLENTFDSHHVQQPGDLPYPYTLVEDMLALQRDIGSSRVMICLDTGHAHIESQDIPQMIRTLRSELATLHLNDNYGRIGPIYEDLHLYPGDGTLEWGAIFEALQEIGFRGAYNIEPIASLRRQTDALRVIALRAARETLQILSRP